MKEKEFVLKHRPSAEVFNNFLVGYFICEPYCYQIAVGDTKAKVWIAAAELIAQRIVLAKYPSAELLPPKTGTKFVIYDPVSCSVLATHAKTHTAWVKAAEAVENGRLD